MTQHDVEIYVVVREYRYDAFYVFIFENSNNWSSISNEIVNWQKNLNKFLINTSFRMRNAQIQKFSRIISLDRKLEICKNHHHRRFRIVSCRDNRTSTMCFRSLKKFRISLNSNHNLRIFQKIIAQNLMKSKHRCCHFRCHRFFNSSLAFKFCNCIEKRVKHQLCS